MDINANLQRQREIRSELADFMRGGNYFDQGEFIEMLTELVELTEAMDNWLSSGGFPPNAWLKAAS